MSVSGRGSPTGHPDSRPRGHSEGAVSYDLFGIVGEPHGHPRPGMPGKVDREDEGGSLACPDELDARKSLPDRSARQSEAILETMIDAGGRASSVIPFLVAQVLVAQVRCPFRGGFSPAVLGSCE